MAIVHLGCVSVQVERRGCRRVFLEELWRQEKDGLGRQRAVKRAQKVPIWVAQGVWPVGGWQELVV